MMTNSTKRERPAIWVSLFKNFTDSHPIGEVDILHWLTNPSHELLKALDLIRQTNDKKLRNTIKARLPAITPSGLFSVRKIEGLISHSGLICLDIDAGDNPTIDDWNGLKSRLPDLEHILYAGLSASGRGLFCLVPIADGKQHLQHFFALERDFLQAGIVLDPTCKDVSRLRGFAYDPDTYVNFGARVYEKVQNTSVTGCRTPTVCPPERNPTPSTEVIRQDEVSTPEQRLLQPTDLSRTASVLAFPKPAEQRFLDLLERIEAQRTDITTSYHDWFTIGCVIATLFGADGLPLFHRISCFYPNYDYSQCEVLFRDILKRGYRSSIDKLLSIAERYGLR